ncbi:hypothetical protein CVT25_009717 [Psilocybe cyanescens]|uniref:Uncharacterized protein n=1 Tax=Psilocybe cyanescens TaxID=93625 RepID=A0A409WWL7_PSICY|nr:hypothetical protein CVT25_009717 [Psilocybe cyanescens]
MLLKEGIEKGPTGKDVLRPRYNQVWEAVVKFEDEERRDKQIEQEQCLKAALTAQKDKQPIRGLRSTTRAVAAPDQVLWIGPPKKQPSAATSGNTATLVINDVEEINKPKNTGKAKAVSKRTTARAVDSMDTDDNNIIMISTKKSETISQVNMKAPTLNPPKQKDQTVPQATTSHVAAAASQPLLKNTSCLAAVASEPTPKAAKFEPSKIRKEKLD